MNYCTSAKWRQPKWRQILAPWKLGLLCTCIIQYAYVLYVRIRGRRSFVIKSYTNTQDLRQLRYFLTHRFTFNLRHEWAYFFAKMIQSWSNEIQFRTHFKFITTNLRLLTINERVLLKFNKLHRYTMSIYRLIIQEKLRCTPGINLRCMSSSIDATFCK